MNKDFARRIKLFRIVREIPYHIGIGSEQDYCCSTKARILHLLLKSIGIKSRYMICEFRWENLNLPEDILKLPHEYPETHQYLEVWIPEKEKWVVVDPTWDSRIKHPSILIAEWDGLNDTIIAVKVEKKYTPEESEKHIEKEKSWTKEEIKNYMNKNRKFFIAFNNWLESLRSF